VHFSDGSAAQYRNKKISIFNMNKILVSLVMALLSNEPWEVTNKWNGRDSEKASCTDSVQQPNSDTS
jgi:hypothetical protein